MYCATLLHDWKKYLTFYNKTFYNFKNGKNYSSAASIFNETQFLEVHTASLSTQKKEKRRKKRSSLSYRNLSYENIFITFKYTLLFFTLLFFWHKYKGHDFLQVGAFTPVALSSTTRLSGLTVDICKNCFSIRPK